MYEIPKKILTNSLQEEYKHHLSTLLCIQEINRRPETMELYSTNSLRFFKQWAYELLTITVLHIEAITVQYYRRSHDHILPYNAWMTAFLVIL